MRRVIIFLNMLCVVFLADFSRKHRKILNHVLPDIVLKQLGDKPLSKLYDYYEQGTPPRNSECDFRWLLNGFLTLIDKSIHGSCMYDNLQSLCGNIFLNEKSRFFVFNMKGSFEYHL